MKIGDLKIAIGLTCEEKEIFGSVLNYQEDTELDIGEIRKELENLEEIADSLTYPYTADLLDWYKEDLDRIYYIEDAIKELGATDGFGVLSGGQFLYFREKVNEVKDKILEYLKELESK